MLTNFPGLGLEIIVDKVFVKETSINVSLSLAVDRNTVDISKVLQFRLMSVATDNSTRFTTLKNNAPFSTLKYNIYNKNNEFNYFDFNVFLKSRTSYKTEGEDGAEVDYFKLGMFEVNHTQEEFRKENILVSCMEIPNLGSSLTMQEFALINATAPAFSLAVKENNELYPNILNPFLREDGDSLSESEQDLVIFQSSFDGQTSFLNVPDEPTQEETLNKRKQTSFSDLFPSIRDNSFNFLFFFDIKTAIKNNSTIFSLLSEEFQQRAISQTDIRETRLNQVSNLGELKEIAPLFQRNFNNIPDNVVTYSGSEVIKEYTKNLKFNYQSKFKLLNGVYSVLQNLEFSTQQLQDFKEFMNTQFSKTAVYNKGEERFVPGGLEIVLRDFRREFSNPLAAEYEDPAEYFMQLLSDLIFAARTINTEENREATLFALNELLKTISFSADQNTNEFSFNLFFKTFDSVVKILDSIFSRTGYRLSNAGQGKSSLNKSGERSLIDLENDFNYIFEPSRYELRYSYLPNAELISGGSIPEITLQNFASVLEQSISKFYNDVNVPPTRNNNLREIESSSGSGRIDVNSTNYLTINSLKTPNEILSDLSINYSWDPNIFLLTALNLIKYKVLGVNPFVVDPTENVEEKIEGLLTEIFNYLSISTFDLSGLLSVIPPILSAPVLGLGLGSTPEEETSEERSAEEISTPAETLLLFGLLDVLENFIENNNTYEYNKLNLQKRLREVLKGVFLRNRFGYLEGNTGLPYPLYALYQNTVLDIGEAVQTNFFWGGRRRIIENPLNASLLRLNFANIRQIRVFEGFETLEDGSVNLANPIFNLSDISSLSQNDTVFCSMVNYNFGYEDEAWYLNNSNILALPAENEHFFLRNPLSTDAIEFFRRGAIVDSPEFIEETVTGGTGTTTGAAEERVQESASRSGALSREPINFTRSDEF